MPRKRVGRAIPAHRLPPPRIVVCRLAEPFGHLVWVESKPWSVATAETAHAELLGVVVDPAAADAPPPRDLLGGYELGAGSRGLAGCQQLGESLRQGLDRLGIEAELLGPAAHLFLPKGARLTFGLPGQRSAWWAIRACAISM